MTSLLERFTSSSEESRGASDRLPSQVRVRRPVLAIASVALVFASIAIFVSIYSSANHQMAVIAIARAVPLGQRVTAGDLGGANVVASDSGSPVPVAEARDVVGKLAAVTLVPGSLLTMADVSSSRPLESGDAVVGIALKEGQLPSSGVEPGDQVMVVQTGIPGAPAPNTAPTPGGTATTTGVLVPSAQVYAVATPPASSSGSATQLVSIEVSSTVAAGVSVAAAADQVSLVLLPQGTAGP